MIEYSVAGEEDWPQLLHYYQRVYRLGHPLRHRDFWRWRFGSAEHGRAFLAWHQGQVVGQVAAAFGGGYAWIINVVLDPAFRGQGVLGRLYAMARQFHPLAATNVNRAGLNMYRNMKWTRYCDLQRFTALNPELEVGPALCQPRQLQEPLEGVSQGHYWRQPGLTGLRLADGSTAVEQMGVGGLRIVDMGDPRQVRQLAWRAGAAWIDFITSWSDPLCRVLEDLGWLCGPQEPIPWDLNPVVWGSCSAISLLAQEHLPPDFIVRRTFSDHGRVGSLPAQDQ